MMSTIEARETELRTNLDALEDWFSQYEYLLGFAEDLDELPEEERTAQTRIEGCTAPAWLSLAKKRDGSIALRGTSDALTVRALLGLIADLIAGIPSEEIASWEPTFMEHAALQEHFTTDRKAGLQEALRRIRAFAAEG